MSITLYNPLVMTVAEWIKKLRIHLDLTQAQMAQRVHVSLPTYQRWEYGSSRPGGPAMALLDIEANEAGFDPPPEAYQITYGPRRREGQ